MSAGALLLKLSMLFILMGFPEARAQWQRDVGVLQPEAKRLCVFSRMPHPKGGPGHVMLFVHGNLAAYPGAEDHYFQALIENRSRLKRALPGLPDIQKRVREFLETPGEVSGLCLSINHATLVRAKRLVMALTDEPYSGAQIDRELDQDLEAFIKAYGKKEFSLYDFNCTVFAEKAFKLITKLKLNTIVPFNAAEEMPGLLKDKTIEQHIASVASALGGDSPRSQVTLGEMVEQNLNLIQRWVLHFHPRPSEEMRLILDNESKTLPEVFASFSKLNSEQQSKAINVFAKAYFARNGRPYGLIQNMRKNRAVECRGCSKALVESSSPDFGERMKLLLPGFGP